MGIIKVNCKDNERCNNPLKPACCEICHRNSNKRVIKDYFQISKDINSIWDNQIMKGMGVR